MSQNEKQFCLIGVSFQKRFPTSNATPWLRILSACAARLLPLLLMMLPATLRAQFTYNTNNGTITITKYTGSDGVVDIPSTITRLPVTCIGSDAFYHCVSLTNVTIPNSVTNIGEFAFSSCTS